VTSRQALDDKVLICVPLSGSPVRLRLESQRYSRSLRSLSLCLKV